MKPTQNLSFLEKVTRRLAETFQEIHELCLSELQKVEVPPRIEQEVPIIQAPPAIQIDIESPQQLQKESKTKKIKKEGEDRQAEDSKSRKKSKKIITNKPKAPASSFLLFFKQQQANISKAYPNLGVTELTKVAAKCWNQLSTQQKDPYIRHCEQERRLYQQKMEKYRIDFPHQIAEKQKQRRRQPKKEKKNVKDTPKKDKGIQIEENNQVQPNGNFAIVQEYGMDSNNEDDDDSLGIV